jgi:hypothetical protein
MTEILPAIWAATRIGATVLLCTGPVGAEEGVPRLLLGTDFQARPVRLVAIDSRTVTYLDALGLQRTEGLEEFLGLLGAEDGGLGAPALADQATDPEAPTLGPPRPSPFLSMVELTDGQRFAGLPAGKPGDDIVMEWNTAEFGDLQIPLELVRRVRLRPVAPGAAPTAAGSDALLLANGDVLEGFVESIGEPTRIEHDSTTVDVPLERIAEIRLGGPPVPPSGVMVWLRSGTIVSVSAMQTGRDGRLSLTPTLRETTDGATESNSWPVPMDDLVAAAFDVGRLTPLATIRPAEQAPDPERRWSEPVRVGDSGGAVLGAADIELPGPMTVSWRLPEMAERLGGVAVLPEDCRTWGDCVLVLSVTAGSGPAREVLRAAITASAPQAPFSVALPGGLGRSAMLTATLEAGQYGPIQDRVVLRRTVILLAR